MAHTRAPRVDDDLPPATGPPFIYEAARDARRHRGASYELPPATSRAIKPELTASFSSAPRPLSFSPALGRGKLATRGILTGAGGEGRWRTFRCLSLIFFKR